MGSYSGFLILEDMLNSLPDTDEALLNEAQSLLYPTATVVSSDCGTKLGRVANLSLTSVGEYDLALDKFLTPEDVTALLGLGRYVHRARDAGFCTAEQGVCAKCAQASLRLDSPPAVGQVVELACRTKVAEEALALPEGVTVMTLSVPEGASYFEVYLNGSRDGLSTDWTQEGLVLTFEFPSAVGDVLAYRLYSETSGPLMSFLSATYSGSVLGMSYLETSPLPLRWGTLAGRYTAPRLSALSAKVSAATPEAPKSLLDYSETIQDPLERALFLLCLYGAFSDVE